MTDSKFVSGWKTMLNGDREPMTSGEADAIMDFVEAARTKQAAAYPTTYDTLRAFIDADERMRDLGWKTYIFDLVDGEEVAVAERGSTGIFHASWVKPYLHFHDCVGAMGKHFIKRIADLSPDELATMNRCSADHAEYMRHQCDRLARLQSAVEEYDK